MTLLKTNVYLINHWCLYIPQLAWQSIQCQTSFERKEPHHWHATSTMYYLIWSQFVRGDQCENITHICQTCMHSKHPSKWKRKQLHFTLIQRANYNSDKVSFALCSSAHQQETVLSKCAELLQEGREEISLCQLPG